jgi:hypothetical protein
MGKEQYTDHSNRIAAPRFPQMPDGSRLSGPSVLTEIMDWVIPDGRVEFPKGEIGFAPAVDVAQLPPKEREETQLYLAKVLYNHMKDVWTAPGNPVNQQRREDLEPSRALEFAPYRNDPAFLNSVATIVDEVIKAKEERSSRAVYPTVY